METLFFLVIYDNVIYLQHLNLLFNFVVLLCYTTSEQVVVFDVQDEKKKYINCNKS